MEYLTKVNKEFAKKGYRSAPARNFLLREFCKNKKPLSAPLLLALFKRKKRGTNKTTVYRGLDLLEKEGVIERVEMGDSQKWYEAVLWGHHHHAVCEKCGEVEDLEIPVKIKRELEQMLTKKNFETKRHAIEFFGLCVKCQKITNN